ncbi:MULTISPECIES: hypothetical protein [Aeromonas]|jgi:hypothetical protein|uniref:hypothetical protein n=1 Tax=Aeromonas TaxID=642 RepID=UPI001116CBED|nr:MULTISPECIES: hypothetical protein [Aeromonas]MXQ69645.1 hypothetical protein [Aeromonas caviae]TNH91245.1 hypothetical protein CF138_00810 [Aeromonas hydrophila]TNI02862.1 hypothetical protein CF136_04455 [Aeromonas hydrophila]TNI99428.1 hypothetical protein CF118_03790 [Aeromonas hydrophila]
MSYGFINARMDLREVAAAASAKFERITARHSRGCPYETRGEHREMMIRERANILQAAFQEEIEYIKKSAPAEA